MRESYEGNAEQKRWRNYGVVQEKQNILKHEQETKLKDYLFVEKKNVWVKHWYIRDVFSVHDKERNKNLRKEIEETPEKC